MSTTEKNLVDYHCLKCRSLLVQSHQRKHGSVCPQCGETSQISLPAGVKRRNHAIVSMGLVDAIRLRDGTWNIPGKLGVFILVRRLSREVINRKGIPEEHELALDGDVVLQLRKKDDDE